MLRDLQTPHPTLLLAAMVPKGNKLALLPPPNQLANALLHMLLERLVESVPKPQVHILWVHSTLVEKGEVSKGYFNQVISRCNQIKIESIMKGKTELAWCPVMQGQPTYDKTHSRGKIVCLNQQTTDFWVKYIPIACNLVGDISCKAWTSEEYKVKMIRYSCLILKNSWVEPEC